MLVAAVHTDTVVVEVLFPAHAGGLAAVHPPTVSFTPTGGAIVAELDAVVAAVAPCIARKRHSATNQLKAACPVRIRVFILIVA